MLTCSIVSSGEAELDEAIGSILDLLTVAGAVVISTTWSSNRVILTYKEWDATVYYLQHQFPILFTKFELRICPLEEW